MSSDATSLELTLFGGPRVTGPDGPVSLSPQQLALLTLVHAEGRSTRAKVIRTLWGEGAHPASRARLRQTLHQTNTRLGCPGISGNGDELYASEHVRSEMDVVRSALSGGDLRPAGELMALGFASTPFPSLRDDYDEWRIGFDARIRRELAALAVSKWEESSRNGSWHEARDAAECLYALRPADATAVSRIIEARARAGKPGLAEAAFTTYCDHLGGREPVPEVEEAIHRVRSLQPSRSESGDRDAPFVGRTDALAAASESFDRVAAGDLAVVLITGEGGIGKSRLLRELERDAVLRGFRCLKAKPVELEQRIPLNPLLDALGPIDLRPHLERLGPPWSAIISAQLPGDSYSALAADLPVVEDSSLSRRLLDSFALLLEQLALEQSTVLFIDDLHWADATTVAALQFFQRRWTRGSFAIVATVRTDAISTSEPAHKYLNTGDEGLAVHRIELGDLADEEAITLIESIAGGAIDGAEVDRIRALAGPHPLFLTELTRDYLAGQLDLPELPADEVPIPVSLRQILNARISRLSEEARKLAGLLAVGHRPMRLHVLAQLCNSPLDECTGQVEELVQWRLVEADHDVISISHDLFRSALYREMSEPRRAMAHKAIANHLLRESPHESAGELAIHLSRAGEREAAAHHGWSAGQRALEAGAMAEAAYFFELVTNTESDATRRAEATAKLALSLHLNRNIERANPALELAATRLREVGDLRLARRMEIRRVDGLAEIARITTEELVDRLGAIKADARHADDWEGIALALDVELRLLGVAGDVPAVVELCNELREVAAHGPRDAKAVALGGLAVASQYGDPTQGLAAAQEAVRLTVDASEERRFQSLNRFIISLWRSGQLHLDEYRALIDEAAELARNSGDLHERYSFESNLAVAALDSGELDRAEVLLGQAGRFLGPDATFGRVNHACNLAELALAKSNFPAAATEFAAMRAYAGATTPKYAMDFANAGLGLCALERGAVSEARRHEQELNPPPDTWYFDPTIVLTFRSRLLQRRGFPQEAIALLDQAAMDLEGRLVLAWLKIRLEQGRLLLTVQPFAARDHIEQSLQAAKELRLPFREKELARLLSRLP